MSNFRLPPFQRFSSPPSQLRDAKLTITEGNGELVSINTLLPLFRFRFKSPPPQRGTGPFRLLPFLFSFRFLFLFTFLFSFSFLPAQGLAGERNSDQAFLFSAGYGRQFSAIDLEKRFGNAWAIDFTADYLAKGSSWTFGAFGQYIFGNLVKEDVIAGLRTSSGFIIGNQRDPADIQLRMRAYMVGGKIGRIIPLSQKNKRSGIKLSFGAGWLEHRIRIQSDVVQSVNQLVGEYGDGYDRLSSGPALYQFIGYQSLSLSGRVNFYLGVEAIEGFTQNRRDYDFATGGTLEESRMDLLYGVRAGIIIPIYRGEGKEIFY